MKHDGGDLHLGAARPAEQDDVPSRREAGGRRSPPWVASTCTSPSLLFSVLWALQRRPLRGQPAHSPDSWGRAAQGTQRPSADCSEPAAACLSRDSDPRGLGWWRLSREGGGNATPGRGPEEQEGGSGRERTTARWPQAEENPRMPAVALPGSALAPACVSRPGTRNVAGAAEELDL